MGRSHTAKAVEQESLTLGQDSQRANQDSFELPSGATLRRTLALVQAARNTDQTLPQSVRRDGC